MYTNLQLTKTQRIFLAAMQHGTLLTPSLSQPGRQTSYLAAVTSHFAISHILGVGLGLGLGVGVYLELGLGLGLWVRIRV